MQEIETACPSNKINNISVQWVNELFNYNYITFEYQSYKNEFVNILSYFIYYGFIPLHLPKLFSDTERFNIALITLSSAPWMGAVSSRYSTPLSKLIKLDILTYNIQIKEIEFSLSLNINSKFLSKFQSVAFDINMYYRQAMINHEKRFFLHNDLGWTLGAENLKSDILKMVTSHTDNITVKLIAYHGRTWFGVDAFDGFIQDALDKYSNLFFQILLVDPKANIQVREGATEKEHQKSSQNGLIGINNMLQTNLKRVEIRLYGEKVDSAYLRGMIIEDSKGNILSTHITNWRFGYERGIYGKELLLHSEASLSKLCRNYFNDVFKNAKPIGRLHRRILYYLKNNLSFFILILLPVLAIWLSVIFAKDQKSAIFSTVLSIIITLWGAIAPICLNNMYKKR